MNRKKLDIEVVALFFLIAAFFLSDCSITEISTAETTSPEPTVTSRNELQFRYQNGVAVVEEMLTTWKRLENR